MSRFAAVEDMAPAEKGRASALPPQEGGRSSIFDAVLFPNRSLDSRGYIAVMAVVIAANLTMGVWFLAIGAWPVLGFCGLDVFLVWLAFRLSYRQGRLHERVRIDAEGMRVSRVLPSGHESRWRLSPLWTRLVIDRPGDHEVQVRLVSKGKSLVLGSFLSPAERASFGEALRTALAGVRG